MNEEDKVNRNKTRNHSNVIKITGLDSSRNNSNGSNPNVRKNNSISPQALSTRGKVNTKKFGEQEMILKSIEDWNILESKLRNEPDYELPVNFLADELGIDKWNNIPVPLVNATESFERSFGNVSRVLQDLIIENKRKS